MVCIRPSGSPPSPETPDPQPALHIAEFINMLLDEQLFEMTGTWAWGRRGGTELI